MKKTLIIIKREYLSRVKKRSFIFMTILGPLLLGALVIVPFYINQFDKETKIIDVVDETHIYGKLGSNNTVIFNYLKTDINAAKKIFEKDQSNALLYIPKPYSIEPTYATLFYNEKQPGNTVTSYIEEKMKYAYENNKFTLEFGIDKANVDRIKANIQISSENIKTGKRNAPIATSLIGFVAGFMIYFSVFMFGSLVMRGVIEEKTSRIVEVIVSSVKPFQLMMGKIIGIALVGLTQFTLWLLLTLGIVFAFQSSVMPKTISDKNKTEFQFQTNNLFPENISQKPNDSNQQIVDSVWNSLASYDFVAIVALFFFYFLFGYLLYGALMAAVGSAVDSEADTQQFLLPITVPLIFSLALIYPILDNPQGQLAFWFSIIPLTSPVVMMMRLPFGVPPLDLILSIVLLILGFLGATWMASKIYRTGILMYGKKSSWKELWKWLKY